MISLRVKDFDWVWKKKWVVQRVSPHVWFWNTHMRAITSFKRLSFTHQQALQTFVWGLKFVWSSQFNQTRWTRFESKDKRKSVNRTLTLFVFKSKSRPCVLWVSRLRDCMLERQRAREKERLKERERERESESERNIIHQLWCVSSYDQFTEKEYWLNVKEVGSCASESFDVWIRHTHDFGSLLSKRPSQSKPLI